MSKIDLESFAKDFIKAESEKKFQADMALMQEELKKVDEGKYPHTSILGVRSSFHAL